MIPEDYEEGFSLLLFSTLGLAQGTTSPRPLNDDQTHYYDGAPRGGA
jgi:hypothetical protein